MTRMIIIGAPGSGKGTQAEYLAAHFGIPAISTGELFRTHVREQTELGVEASRFMDRGELVPDRLTDAMVARRLDGDDVGNGFLLDGYPRNLAQLAALDALLADDGKQLDAVVRLDLDEGELVRRLLQRASEQGRSDDTEEVIRRRLELYQEETLPVVTAYAERGIVVDVDGGGDRAVITERAIAALGSFLETPR
ncbi:adenylate kinase [Arthrobacter celericrescens]|uniref:adenylate kinase n=1 Tax=Arthrobacter celericrescens TaxID=2320851 RepID=UPI000EA19E40|nr:adenylate kinase [Arthrobacter celericrescens]